MPKGFLTERLKLHIELALDRDCTCKRTLAKLDRRADRLGLTGVEVDAARELHSFDIRIAAAIDFACALGSDEPVRIHAAVVRALMVGYNMLELKEVAKLAYARDLGMAKLNDMELNPALLGNLPPLPQQ
jgi:hypothetical protein